MSDQRVKCVKLTGEDAIEDERRVNLILSTLDGCRIVKTTHTGNVAYIYYLP